MREAQAAGFTHLLTLDPGLADARVPLAVNRYFPTHNPSLADLVANLRPDPHELRVARFACLDAATLWSGDVADDDVRLGRVIERTRALGLTAVVVDGVLRDAQHRVVAVWFPNRELPVAGDLLARIAWQLQTRAGVAVHVRLPHRDVAQALGNDESRVLRFFDDLGAMVPLSGWMMEGTTPPSVLPLDDLPSPSGDPAHAQRGWAAWAMHERRRANLARLQQTDGDASAWRVFARLEAARPGLRLLWLAPSSATEAFAPHPLADFTLIPHPLDNRGELSAPASVDARMTR